MNEPTDKKRTLAKFQHHVNILMWKAYTQRQRRWRVLLVETVFAALLFLIAVFLAKPVFLTPIQEQGEAPLSAEDILESLHGATILGFAPNVEPYATVMGRAAMLLQRKMFAANTYDDLNLQLYEYARGRRIRVRVIWIIFESKENNFWKFSIRSTEVARYTRKAASSRNMHLRAGFLAVQLAVSQAICEFVSQETTTYQLRLVSMPVSPLMEEGSVRRAISLILLCFTIALLPPVMETEAIVVGETKKKFKRALRMYEVNYSTMYLGWLLYMLLSALPICVLGSITLILIFRWIHLIYALFTLIVYVTVMMTIALIMAMFHSDAYIACIWTGLFTLMQTFLAELMMHHKVHDYGNQAVTFLIHMFLPPSGLVHGFNQFALLQTGSKDATDSTQLVYTVLAWMLMILVYFQLVMLLQHTVSSDRAIGGRVSWKSIIFKKVEDTHKLRKIDTPTGNERETVQEVDEFVAKAISFRNVSKSIMGVPVLTNLTFDIYRGEFTNLFAQRVQEKMMSTIENMLVGLTFANKGSINVLGTTLTDGGGCMTEPLMMGYCHRSKMLLEDLTVAEHITLFTEICLWNETSQFLSEYIHMRTKRLLEQCDLVEVKDVRVINLDAYYRAQLCWALATLLEPRIIIVPNFEDSTSYMTVIKDKIMTYKKFMTIVKISYSSINIEYADRVFVFDNKILGFGGTPAYMFFKYGREYRLRVTLEGGATLSGEGSEELLEEVAEAGATVRAHLGSVLILRLPTSPTANVAALVKTLEENAEKYGIVSMNISLPDSEEVTNRAISEIRAKTVVENTAIAECARVALTRISVPKPWNIKARCCCNMRHLRCFAWKYTSFYIHYRFFLIITIISTIVTGVFIGLSLASLFATIHHSNVDKIFRGEILTVEYLEQPTILVLRLDNSSRARSMGNAYVMSQTNANDKQVKKMAYTALERPDSLTEYLVTRAIDSPQHYVVMYAYGMDVRVDSNENLFIKALYSPLHHDSAAAARALARVHMSLLRHYTGQLDASIEVTDNPLVLDQTPWLESSVMPPLLIQFLLVLTITHLTLVPSKEHGLIRHFQTHTLNFSPARYWFSLYFCDLVLYWMLVGVMTAVIWGITYLIMPPANFYYRDLLVVPFLLILYGIGSAPQAYLFSLGPRPALNTMAFMIFNIVFGETTILAKLFYGNMYAYAMNFMILSSQFNMANALMKIFTYILLANLILYKCGVLQKCYEKQSYLTQSPGIITEVFGILATAVIFMTLLMLWEYKVILRAWGWLSLKLHHYDHPSGNESIGVLKQKDLVLEKKRVLNEKAPNKDDPFGAYLLAAKVSKKIGGRYALRNIYFGLGKGEILALSGLKRHGRLRLCEILAGFRLPTEGYLLSMSKWKLTTQPHRYSSNISLCCDLDPLPPWMTVRDALELIASLRGVPKRYIDYELDDYIKALELWGYADILVCRLQSTEKKRLAFIAAVIGAPPIIVLDECTAYQKYTVRRAMYFILDRLRHDGHAICICSHNVESHMPVNATELGIIMDGRLFDIDSVDNLLERYGNKGYTVVVHLKDEVNVNDMFREHFQNFVINDTSEVLVNVQILDTDLTWTKIFENMEKLQKENQQIYSYIVSAIPIDYIYNSILAKEQGLTEAPDMLSWCRFKRCFQARPQKQPSKEALDRLKPFEKKYSITKLTELPWSVIFQR